jgi:ABC-type multidrug transport system fused ATPase/permease subunit
MLSNDVYTFSQNQTGKYISGLNNDVTAIETGYIENIFAAITYIALFLGGLVAMAYFNLMMFSCVIAGALLPILVSLLLSGNVAKGEKRVSEKNDIYVSNLRDMLAGFSVIKSFQVEGEMKQIFDEKNCELESAKRYKRNVISNVVIFSNLAANMLLVIVFGVGAYLAISGQITAGVVVGCIQLLNYISNPIQELPTVFSRIQAAHALVDKMQEDIESSRDESEAIRIESFQNEICCECCQ